MLKDNFPTHIFLDFDGTITNLAGEISAPAVEMLTKLAGKCLRVIATGRTVSSFCSRVKADFPIDYLIFSTGAGIMDWQQKKIINYHSFDAAQTKQITELLQDLKFSFSRHHPIPDNHKFEYFQGEHDVEDFRRYLQLHAKDKILESSEIANSTQFLIITDDKDYPLGNFAELHEFANIFKISSPIDHQTTWIEILPKNVSKSRAAQHLLTILDQQPRFTVAVGNDYNDTDLIVWADQGFIVSTADSDLLANYPILENAQNDGVARLLRNIIYQLPASYRE
ncbi:MAG: HAD family hydrolase [Candidatus Cloacimonadales bacterium]